MELQIKKLDPNATLPTYGSEDAAGMDLCALRVKSDNPDDNAKSIEIGPGETKFIQTGIAMAIPKGYVGLLFARSGLACKKGLAPANKVGVIDADYRGEIIVALHNHNTDAPIIIDKGERIAQLAIVPYLKMSLTEVENLDDTTRGEGGFGSTGSK